ncbi:MAG: FecR family protein, partial [Bdellovibrionota bacterium]
MKIFLFVSLLLVGNSFASQKLAEVVFVKGNVQIYHKPATEGKWVNEGMVIQTDAKSIAKLIFIDKTQITVAPQSQLEITSLKKNAPPMLSLLSGAIRSKVQKQLVGEGQGKDKLFIKTKTAAMG